ncbi:MAG: transcription elongation factor GreA [Myxococcales bacterium]|nr:transcription elongation factor GreA [Myxococcales bacterium]MCB9645659.1 transcription elongation factor GreA [Deltaproteobacteria bacterium]
MSDREPMTVTGYARLKDELKDLKSVQRPAISAAIEEARAHGDLKENAEYHAAKEKQAFIEGRIKEVESKLALAEVIDPSTLTGDKVVFGATVTVVDGESGETSRYQIVGLDEADLKEGKISLTAPIARALMGKRVGDIVEVKLPKRGNKELEVEKVEFV